jgi:hypothetical protein
MTLGKTTAFQTRAFAVVLVVMAGSLTCGPASAHTRYDEVVSADEIRVSAVAQCGQVTTD